MLLFKLRFVLCLCLCVGFLSGNAQINELVKELQNNSRSLYLASVKDPARGQAYNISASGSIISFRKTGKLIASLNLAKLDPSNVAIIKRTDRIMLQFVLKDAGAFKYYDPSSNSYKANSKNGQMKGSIIHLPNYSRADRLLYIAQYAVFTAVPKRNMNLRCSGNAKNLKKVGIRVRAIMNNGSYKDIDGGRFVVRGSVGTYVIKNVPIGAKIGVWINYPSEYSGENSDSRIPAPDKTFMMAPTVASWNRQKNQMGGATFHMNLK